MISILCYLLYQSQNMSRVQDMVRQGKKLINAYLFSFCLHLHEEGMIQVQTRLVPIRNNILYDDKINYIFTYNRFT